MNRERELKYDLGGEDAARRLEARLGRAASACWQVSRFFDSARGHLSRARLALRLRAEWPAGLADEPSAAGPPPGRPGRVLLTVKGARRQDGPLHDRPEREIPLEFAAWSKGEWSPDELPVDWRGLLPPEVAGQTLTEVVRFTNLRRRYALPPRWQAEVDRPRFADGPAWEIEMELGPGEDPDPARRALEELLASCAIAARAQERSKLERALAARRP